MTYHCSLSAFPSQAVREDSRLPSGGSTCQAYPSGPIERLHVWIVTLAVGVLSHYVELHSELVVSSTCKLLHFLKFRKLMADSFQVGSCVRPGSLHLFVSIQATEMNCLKTVPPFLILLCFALQ